MMLSFLIESAPADEPAAVPVPLPAQADMARTTPAAPAMRAARRVWMGRMKVDRVDGDWTDMVSP